MFLATTALSEFWDTQEEVLFLGSWCLRDDRPPEGTGLRYQVMPSPWNDRKRFYDAARYLDECGERILCELGAYLNTAHGAGHGVRYWRTLIGPWVMHALHQTYDRYVHLTHAFERRGDLKTFVLDPESFKVPCDTVDAMELVCEDEYNLQIFSQLLLGMGYRFPTRRLPVEWRRGPVLPKRTRLRDVRAKLGNAASRAVGAIGRTFAGRVGWAAVYDLGLDRSPMWDLARATTFRAVPHSATDEGLPRGHEPVFDGRRTRLATLPSLDEFERLFVRSLPIALPTLYLEGYPAWSGAACKGRRGTPSVIVSGSDWHFNEAFKFLAAEAAEQGTRLVAVQHGGGYGIFRFSAAELHEWRVGDSFFVWGWAGDRSEHLRNVPSPRLSSLRGEPLGVDRDENATIILFMATAHPRYLYRFHSQPVGSQWSDYKEWQERFLAATPERLRSVLTFRPYPYDYGQGIRDRITRKFSDVRCDISSSIDQLLRRARIVVIDHNSSAFLETLAADIPTILFWDRNRWEVRKSAEPYFEKLREVGVLLDSPEAAAGRLSEIYERLPSWWGSESVRRARADFVDRFALNRDDWVKQWSDALRHEIALNCAEVCEKS